MSINYSKLLDTIYKGVKPLILTIIDKMKQFEFKNTYYQNMVLKDPRFLMIPGKVANGISEGVAWLAVIKDTRIFKYIPDKHKSKALSLLALIKDARTYPKIPIENRDCYLDMIAVLKDSRNFKHVPESFKNNSVITNKACAYKAHKEISKIDHLVTWMIHNYKLRYDIPAKYVNENTSYFFLAIVNYCFGYMSFTVRSNKKLCQWALKLDKFNNEYYIIEKRERTKSEEDLTVVEVVRKRFMTIDLEKISKVHIEE